MNPTCELPSPDRCFRERPAERPESADPGSAHLESAHLELAYLEALLQRMIGGIVRWRRRRAAICALRSLNDHSLADIGLERVQTVWTLEAMIRERPSGAGGAIIKGKTQSRGRQG